jgi:hypothetical protein
VAGDTGSLEGRSVQRIGEMPSRLLRYGVLVEPGTWSESGLGRPPSQDATQDHPCCEDAA